MSIDAAKELTGIERAHLSAWTGEESFRIVQTIMEDLVKEFNLDLINCSKNEDILAKHHIAKAAAVFYQRFVDRLNQEILIYRSAPKPGDKPIDPTANLELDDHEANVSLEDVETLMSNVPNLLERG